jgi:hypothetical protein
MDFSKFKTSDWLKVGGGAGFLVFGFFSWLKISFAGRSVGQANVFDFFFTGTLPWILIVGSAVIAFLLASGVLKKDTLPWPLIFLAATGLGALLLLIRLIFNPIDEADGLGGFGGPEIGRGFGMILSAISGVVAAVGGFLGFKESGGDLNDLTDMDKLKGAFNQGGGSTPPPPPPPPGMTPPPPPPPPAG